MTAVLYILMRNDLASMNAGKGMAQASHASNAFTHHFNGFSQEINARPVNMEENVKTIKGFNEWENSTSQGFGTVLTLEAKMAEIKPVVDIFKAMDYIAGIVHDPTYPIVDGEIVHHIPLDTCAYIFVPNKEEDQIASMLLKKFPLHR
jgi:hypothetical protein